MNDDDFEFWEAIVWNHIDQELILDRVFANQYVQGDGL